MTSQGNEIGRDQHVAARRARVAAMQAHPADPDAAAVYAEIEDDKTPDPMPEPTPRPDPRVEVWRIDVRGHDVVTITGLTTEAALTLLQILDKAANVRNPPPWGHTDPIRRGLRKALREDETT